MALAVVNSSYVAMCELKFIGLSDSPPPPPRVSPVSVCVSPVSVLSLSTPCHVSACQPALGQCHLCCVIPCHPVSPVGRTVYRGRSSDYCSSPEPCVSGQPAAGAGWARQVAAGAAQCSDGEGPAFSVSPPPPPPLPPPPLEPGLPHLPPAGTGRRR